MSPLIMIMNILCDTCHSLTTTIARCWCGQWSPVLLGGAFLVIKLASLSLGVIFFKCKSLTLILLLIRFTFSDHSLAVTAIHCGYGPAPLARVFTASLDQVYSSYC